MGKTKDPRLRTQEAGRVERGAWRGEEGNSRNQKAKIQRKNQKGWFVGDCAGFLILLATEVPPDGWRTTGGQVLV